MAVSLITLSHHLALEQFRGGEQGGGAVSFVIMGQGPAAPLLHGQAGLAAIESLHLALFIDGWCPSLNFSAFESGMNRAPYPP